MEATFALEFEWDERKAAANLAKHGVTFFEAATVLDDPFAITYPDIDHSGEEDRYITVGLDHHQRLLIVAHAARPGLIRIISARRGTRTERKHYEQG